MAGAADRPERPGMSDTRVAPEPVTEERAAEGAPAGSGWSPRRLSPLAILILVALGLGGIAAVLAAWRLPPFRTAYETTDNAYVRGRTTIISPQVSGYVAQVSVRDYEDVRA